MQWKLDQTIITSAGSVAAGCAGEGRPLVLAHGWPWSSFSWHRVIPALARRYRVYWYDMPGYGQSGKHADQRTSLDVQGALFAEMLAHWQLVCPMVVAHDFGGATTLRAHLLHGCAYSRYLLMNVVALRPWGSEFFDHVRQHGAAFAGLPPHIHAAVVRAYIAGAIATRLDPEDLEALAVPWLSEEGRASFYRQFAQADECYTAEVEALYPDIRCPVKILWGERDPWIPLARGKALHETIPQAEFEVLAGVGHLPQLEAPERVVDAIGRFLDAPAS
ncbi:MAG: alpha/beta hydrolase [Burkholderiaceae bacterium]